MIKNEDNFENHQISSEEDSHEENFEEHNTDGLECEYEKSDQECEKAMDLGSYQDHCFSMKKLHVFLQKHKHIYKTPLLCRNCMNTITAVKKFWKQERIYQRNEPCYMKLSEDKTFSNAFFQKNPLCFILEYIVMVNVDVNITLQKKSKASLNLQLQWNWFSTKPSKWMSSNFRRWL